MRYAQYVKGMQSVFLFHRKLRVEVTDRPDGLADLLTVMLESVACFSARRALGSSRFECRRTPDPASLQAPRWGEGRPELEARSALCGPGLASRVTATAEKGPPTGGV